jgi:hypothetical protein
VGAENREFLEASLEADQVYLIEVRPTIGAFKAAVKVLPIDPNDAKTVDKVKKTVGKKQPVSMDNSTFADEAESLDFYIQNGMKKYQTDKTKGKSITRLQPEHSFTKILNQQ